MEVPVNNKRVTDWFMSQCILIRILFFIHRSRSRIRGVHNIIFFIPNWFTYTTVRLERKWWMENKNKITHKNNKMAQNPFHIGILHYIIACAKIFIHRTYYIVVFLVCTIFYNSKKNALLEGSLYYNFGVKYDETFIAPSLQDCYLQTYNSLIH